ncbi:G-protein coupled receptor daf-37-like [Physella acuta]|uniref:G-protein coupled receptor daf-37-like n=1 Tax=Physella acuta TaxID=109671 RepID=UPI0027DB615C|nr:G-protein coupled receptor daf-37-like [Physella acuta]
MNHSEGEITHTTVPYENMTDDSFSETVSRDLEKKYIIMKSYVNPIIGCLGLFVNTIGLYILYKSGLKKPSNIFLASLLVADSMYLTGAVNCAGILATVGPGKLKPQKWVWEIERNLAYLVFVIDQLTFFISSVSAAVSPCLPVIITVERLLAVFFPLKFKTLVTRKVALFLVVSLFLFWTPWIAFIAAALEFKYVYVSEDTSYGMRSWSKLMWDNIDVIILCDSYIFNFMTSILPACIVIICCCLIGVKIKLAHRKRKSMSSTKNQTTSRSTITLLTVSLISAIFQSAYFIVSISINDEVLKLSAMAKLFREIQYFINNCASSINTIVYIILNKKLRNTLIDTFTQKHNDKGFRTN